MDLHRTSGKPDWEGVPAARRNPWQRVAAATNSVLTPSNVITMLGYVLVLMGLKAIVDDELVLGGILLAMGRLLDIADGAIAHATGTKSPLGELLDSAIDKIGTAITIIIFYGVAIAPWWVLTALLIPQLIITYLSLRANAAGKPLHPSRIGKYGMVAAWVTLLGFVFVEAAGNPLYLLVPLYVFAGATIALEFRAAGQYSRGKY